MPPRPIITQERGPGAGASIFFTCKCANVIINTWHGAWLLYPACLIKGAAHCSSHLGCLSFTFPLFPSFTPLIPFFLPSVCLLSPSHLHASLLICLPPLHRLSLPSITQLFSHSYIITFFCQLALTMLTLREAISSGPLGTRKWQKAAFIYLCGSYRVVCLIMWLIDNTVSPLARTRTIGNLIHI